MKRFAIPLLAISMMTWSSGCCGWWPCWHGNWGAGYPGLCPGGGCPPAGSVSPSTYPPTGWYDGTTQIQSHQVGPAPVAAAPISYGNAAQSAQVPLESLPTYH